LGSHIALLWVSLVPRGFLGITIQSLTPELAEFFDIEDTQGILITEVSDNSPAAKAGLRQGDVIVAYDDIDVNDTSRFRSLVSLTAPGKRANITIIRDGKRKIVSAVNANRSQDETISTGPSASAQEIGLTVQTNL